MQEEKFRVWLREVRHLEEGTVNSRVANCQRVEQFEGNLDISFEWDRFDGLLRKLKYSKHDEAVGAPARHHVPIDGNIRNGSATLKSAVALYREYRLNECQSSSQTQTSSQVPVRDRRNETLGKQSKRSAWPDWPAPADNDVLAVARMTAPYVKFLSVDVVSALMQDNERMAHTWRNALLRYDIDPSIFMGRLSLRFPRGSSICR